jgi:hypothetical protein
MRIGAVDIRRLIADNSLVVKPIIGTDGDQTSETSQSLSIAAAERLPGRAIFIL